MCLSQVCDEQGTLLYLNDLCRQRLRYPQGEIPRLTEVLVEEMHQRFMEYVRYVLHTSGASTTDIFPLTLRAKDGKRLYVKGRLGLLFFAGKKYVRGDFLDITRQEKLMHIQKICYSIMNFNTTQKPTETLQRSMEMLYGKISEEFREAFQIEHFGVVYTEHNAFMLTDFVAYFDDACAPEERAEQKKLCEALGAEVLERGESLIVFRKGAEKILESRGLDIKKIPHTWIGAEVKFSEDVKAFVCFSSYSPEVSYNAKDLEVMKYLGQQIALMLERNLHDSRIAHQQALLRSLFESSSHMVWFVNQQGVLISFNENFVKNCTRYYGIDLCEGTDLATVALPKHVKQRFHSHYEEAFAGVSVNFECVLAAEDGHKKWIEVFLNPIKKTNEPHKVLEVSAIAHDITSNKKAREAAEHSLQVKKIFLANMSHEIRTPVSGIIGMIDLLESTALNEEQRHYMDVAKKSSETLLHILNDILHLSKIEAGKMVLQKRAFSLRDALQKLCHLFSYQSSKSGVPIDLRIAPDIPAVVVADETRLLQILSNLVSNAIKFSNGRGTIFISVYKQAEQAGTLDLKVKIKDSGVGIAQKDMGFLFKSFSQLEGSTHKRFGGTGLGLIISKKLAESMHGKMGAFSMPHLGSTFWFTLRVDKAMKEDVAPNVLATPTYVLKNRLKAWCPLVLVVDDNAINCKVLDKMLRLAGARPLVATSGAEATRVVKAHADALDCILMDIQMPNKDGFETAKEVRKFLQCPTPIIAVTAYSMEEDRARFLSQGMDDYLAKPVRAKALVETLLRCRQGVTAS